MVALRLVELALLGVGLRHPGLKVSTTAHTKHPGWHVEFEFRVTHRGLLLARPVEDLLDGEHGHDRDELLAAAEVDAGQDALGQRRLERELGHLPPEAGEQALVVQGTEAEEVLHGGDHGLNRRRVHEVEADQVVDAHRLELQHGVPQVGPLDLRHGVREHLILERRLGVQPVALPRPGPAGAAGALLGGGLGDRRDDEGVHPDLRVVDLLLGEPWAMPAHRR